MNLAPYDTLCVVACASMKARAPAPAGELYVSDLFRKSYALARELVAPGAVLIASAKHGLVEPEVELEPYDTMLSDLPIPKQRDWGFDVAHTLHAHFDARETWPRPPNPMRLVHLFAGALYAKPIIAGLEHCARAMSCRYHVHEPLAGMQIGQRLSFLKRELEARAARREVAQP